MFQSAVFAYEQSCFNMPFLRDCCTFQSADHPCFSGMDCPRTQVYLLSLDSWAFSCTFLDHILQLIQSWCTVSSVSLGQDPSEARFTVFIPFIIHIAKVRHITYFDLTLALADASACCQPTDSTFQEMSLCGWSTVYICFTCL